jgi:hypothetical protein
MPVILTQMEGLVEVLRHGAHVTNRRPLRLIVPYRYWDAAQTLQDVKLIQRFEVLFQVPVA